MNCVLCTIYSVLCVLSTLFECAVLRALCYVVCAVSAAALLPCLCCSLVPPSDQVFLHDALLQHAYVERFIVAL